jgi:hypothetical protein
MSDMPSRALRAHTLRRFAAIAAIGIVLACAASAPPPASTGTLTPSTPRGSLASPTAAASPIVLSGSGRASLPAVALPAPISVAHITHRGSGRFSVQSFVGSSGDLLVNVVGAYDGVRPLLEGSPAQLTIDADGAWSVSITPIVCCSPNGEFAGRGDAVSTQFSPPSRQTFEFVNDGERTFVVYAHCLGTDQIVLDRRGKLSTSLTVQFGQGPCWWEVLADATWSIRLKPR